MRAKQVYGKPDLAFIAKPRVYANYIHSSETGGKFAAHGEGRRAVAGWGFGTTSIGVTISPPPARRLRSTIDQDKSYFLARAISSVAAGAISLVASRSFR
jgi:hypothetical protein